MASIRAIILSVSELLLPLSAKATENTTGCGIQNFLGYFAETMIEDFYNVAFGQIVTMTVSKHFLHTKPSRLEIRFYVEKSSDFSKESVEKSWGKESANESNSEFIPYSEEFMNVFMRIGFGSAIELVSFDKSQVVAFNRKFVCGFRNSDCGTKSRCRQPTWVHHPLDRNFEEYQESYRSN
ncbi:hypothetical protein Tco_1514774 [Tanacetum coccineum]